MILLADNRSNYLLVRSEDEMRRRAKWAWKGNETRLTIVRGVRDDAHPYVKLADAGQGRRFYRVGRMA